MVYDYKRVAPRTSSNPCIYVVDSVLPAFVRSINGRWGILWRQTSIRSIPVWPCGGHVPAQTPELGVQQMTHVTASPKLVPVRLILMDRDRQQTNSSTKRYSFHLAHDRKTTPPIPHLGGSRKRDQRNERTEATIT